VGSVDTPTAFDRAASIHANNSILRECDKAHISQPPASLESILERCPYWHQGGDMALGLAKFALVLGMVLAMAVIILTITTGLSSSNSRSESTAPMALE
jgi:hypothetical protein